MTHVPCTLQYQCSLMVFIRLLAIPYKCVKFINIALCYFYISGLEDKVCGNETINGNFVGTSNALTFKYVTPDGTQARWSIIFTAFHEGR